MGKTGILGGTFDTLHDGHHALLITAFEHGDHVIVGITTNSLAERSRERSVTPINKRLSELQDVCQTYANVFEATFELTVIDNPLEPAVDNDNADFIVVSPEQKTHERAASINEQRAEQGKSRLQVIEAPLVTDSEGNKLSSTAVVNHYIDSHGNPIVEE